MRAELEDAALKAVCGLLNAPDGGQLVVGALEIAREVERLKPGDIQGYLGRLRDIFPIYPEPEQSGLSPFAKALVGLEEDYSLNAGYSDWDSFQRYFAALLSRRILPNPLPCIQLTRLSVRGRTLVVVNVLASEHWYYLDGQKFDVREVAQTREYAGLDGDFYRRATPRASPIRGRS